MFRVIVYYSVMISKIAEIRGKFRGRSGEFSRRSVATAIVTVPQSRASSSVIRPFDSS